MAKPVDTSNKLLVRPDRHRHIGHGRRVAVSHTVHHGRGHAAGEGHDQRRVGELDKRKVSRPPELPDAPDPNHQAVSILHSLDPRYLIPSTPCHSHGRSEIRALRPYQARKPAQRIPSREIRGARKLEVFVRSLGKRHYRPGHVDRIHASAWIARMKLVRADQRRKTGLRTRTRLLDAAGDLLAELDRSRPTVTDQAARFVVLLRAFSHVARDLGACPSWDVDDAARLRLTNGAPPGGA
jgi:hypothetical protein